MGEAPSFTDLELLSSLVEVACGQLMWLLDYLECHHGEDISANTDFQLANNVAAAYILWRMKDQSLFHILPELLQRNRAINSSGNRICRPPNGDITGAGHSAGH